MTLPKEKVIRAWKDPAHRASLDAEEKKLLEAEAQHPAGPTGEITDMLDQVAGGYTDTSSDGNSCGYICTYSCECWCSDSGIPKSDC
jgi:mersacidin/lichenicidin family type 2 lantibiotic